MLEFIRVEGAPAFFPYTCRSCQSGKDLLDTHAEDHTGRLYLCRMCVSRGARVFGMIEGNRHAELMQADTSLQRANKALEEYDVRTRDLVEQLAELDRLYADSLEEQSQLRQRVEQLEDAIRAQAQSELALVGAVSFAPGEVATEEKIIQRGLPFVRDREEQHVPEDENGRHEEPQASGQEGDPEH